MAVVTATVTVDFTANYTGDHRVCWRIQSVGGAYDCNTIVNCVGGGTACQAIFTVDVNTTSCDGTVTIEGYIQATCEDITSTGGRLAFSVDYIPTQTCFSYNIDCDWEGVESVTTLSNGDGLYLTGDTVVFTRDGADTRVVDAVANCTVAGGVITINVTTPGEYEIPPVVTLVSGTGSGASFQANLFDCATIASLTNDCSGGNIRVENLSVGDTHVFCTDLGLPAVPANYSVALLGCCIGEDTDTDICFEHTIDNNTVSNQSILHSDCDGNHMFTVVPGSGSVNICAIPGGIIDPDEGVTFTITNTGTPCT